MRVEPALRSAISGACRASTPISPAAPGTITISTSSSKTAPSGVVSEIENLRAPSATSAPSSDTYRFLARDHAAPESTLALAKAASLGRERARPLAWCSRPRNSAALPEGALDFASATSRRHLIGLLLATEEDWPSAFESVL